MPTVSIDKNSKTYELKDGDILFDALDAQGEKLPHGCLAGSCGACRVEILEGAQNIEKASGIEKNTISSLKDNYQRNQATSQLANKEIRLSCKAKVQGDIKIKIIDD